MSDLLSGGCQCGAVRYRLTDYPSGAHLCHCRMCQKAFGSYFAPLAGVRDRAFAVTRGVIATFRSSHFAIRGFCRDCGTPLTYERTGSGWIAVALGSLDRPEVVPPTTQHGVESRLAFFHDLARLPDLVPADRKERETAAMIHEATFQHPDHDTDDWVSRSPTP
jgi:hypothetical protein